MAPITLDSLTSGFNISSDNSNMCLYFLNEYTKYRKIPRQLIDMNIASDYSKLANMLKICQGEGREDIIEKTVSGEGIT